MEFRILGPLEVLNEGRRVPLGGGKQRALLAMLILHANQVVSIKQLSEAIWDQDPPPGWARTLPVHVSNLRKALSPHGAPAPTLIETRPPGYVLTAPPEQVDALRFNALIADAGRATHNDSYADTAFVLAEALSLWRGPMLADFADNPAIQAGIVAFEKARLTAVEGRVEAELALGGHAQLVGELEQLVAEHPLWERLRGHLMVALYRCRRQADALAVYQQGRRALVEDLGLEPSPFLQRLEAAILAHSPALDAPDSASAPPILRPLPGPVQIPHQFHFAGRSPERELLAKRWKQASLGQRLTVLIGGEPGIGKTRLVTEAGLSAHEDGAVVLYGHCDGELRVPYQPFMEAVAHYLNTCSGRQLADHMQLFGAELVLLVPELARRFPNLRPLHTVDAASERFRLFDAVTSLLATASKRTPILFALDDLHWASTPTLLLLRHLLSTAQPMSLLVVGTYRETEVTGGHPLAELLADLRRDQSVDRITLHGLSDEDVVTIVQEATGHALAPDGVSFGRALRRDTGGNPFFLIEILRHLVESGTVRLEQDRWTDPAGIGGTTLPKGVREVIERRLRRLPENAQRALRASAVIGREFNLAVLSPTLGTAEDEVLDSIDEAVSAALVSEVAAKPGWFSFTHVLIRNAIYEGIGITRQARLHERVAETLEQLLPSGPGPHLAELAHHWLGSAQPAARLKAVGYARSAGDWALENLAYEDAAAHYQQALGALDAHDRDQELQRCDMLLALGDAQRRAGGADYRATMAAAADHGRALGEPQRMAQAALGSSRPCSWFISVGYVDEALVELYDDALALLDHDDSALRARLLAQLAVELYWTPARSRRRSLCHEALRIARRERDPATLAYVLASSVVATWDPTTLEERLIATAELVRIGAQLKSREVTLQGSLLLAGCLFEAGDFDRAAREMVHVASLTDELHQPFYTWLAGTVDTMRTILIETPAQGEAAAFATFELGRSGGQPDAALIFAMQYVIVLWDKGQIDQVNQVLGSYVESCPAIPGFRAALALSYCYLGREDEARQHYEPLVEALTDLPFDFIWYETVSILGETCAYLGDTTRAPALYEVLLPYGDRMVLVGNGESCLGSAWRALGLLATTLRRWDDAEQHFAAALAVNGRVGARSFVVRTQRGYAEMLLLRAQPGDFDHAMALARNGRQMADDLGMSLERDILDHVVQAGAPAGQSDPRSRPIQD